MTDPFGEPDDDNPAERMMTEIALGIPKSRSRVIKTKEDAALWDNLARQMGRIEDQGGTAVYGTGRKDG